MTKAKATADNTAFTAESAMENGAQAMKSGVEKAMKNCDTALGFGKDTAEAYMTAATVAGKGIESVNNQIYSYSKQSLEDTIAATKAVMGSKSVHEAFALQTDFVKSAFESYVSEVSKVSEIAAQATKQSYAPLKGRMQAWLDVVQSASVA